MKRILIGLLILSGIAFMQGCDLVNSILKPPIQVSGTISLPSNAPEGGSVWVGLSATVPFQVGSSVSEWAQSTQVSLKPGQQTTYTLSDITPGKYIVVAFCDLNEGNGKYDAGEPAVASSTVLTDFSANKTVNLSLVHSASDDSSLTNLSLSGLDLTFASTTFTYALDAPNTLATTTVSATPTSAAATVTINGVETNQKTVDLAIGSNTVTILVTAEDGSTTSTYTLTITRASILDDATLSSLTSSGLSFSFSSTTLTYDLNAPSSLASTTVTATPTQPNAQLAINGQAVSSLPVQLTAGQVEVVSVVVTAPDGTTQKTYTLRITRAEILNSDATLSTLSASGIPFSFSAVQTVYALNAPSSLSSTTISAQATQSGSTVTINGQTVTSLDVTLPEEEITTVTIVVTAPDTSTTKTYSLEITRAAVLSSDATLKSLTATNTGTWSFTPSLESYSLAVASTTTTTTITASPNDPTATVSIAGGSNPRAVSLAVGSNIIDIVVTAEDGVTTKTYTLTINRAASSVATLSSLTLTSQTLGGVAFSFSPTQVSYSLTVSNDVGTVTVAAQPTEGSAGVTINDQPATSLDINLAVGSNTITIVVTAPDGVTTQTYTLTVTRAQDEASPPGVPTNLQATPRATEPAIDLTWDVVPTAAIYIVYRGDSPGNAVQVAYAYTNSYNDEGLNEGAQYYYQVAAVNSSGIGSRSAEVSTTTISTGTIGITVQ